MAKTIEQLKAQSAEVKNASVIGENTATRVGSLFNDIVEHVEAYEAGQAQKDTEQSTSINAETARATAAETTLSERINQEVTDRKAMDETIGVQLSNEIERAKGMELGISAKLNDEIKRAQAAENNLQEKITSEAEARDLAINNEAQTRTQNDQLLSQAIVAEQERAEAAEQANATAINAAVAKNEEQDQKLSELESKTSGIKNAVQDLNGDTFYVTDSNGNIVAKIDAEGFKAIEVMTQGKKLSEMPNASDMKIASILEHFYEDKLYISDAQGNVVCSISNDGLHVIDITCDTLLRKDWYGKTMATYGDSVTAINNGNWERPYVFDNTVAGNGVALKNWMWGNRVASYFCFKKHYGRGFGGQWWKWNTDHKKADGSFKLGGDLCKFNTVTGCGGAAGGTDVGGGQYDYDDYLANPSIISLGQNEVACRGSLCSWNRIQTCFSASIKDSIDIVLIINHNDKVDDGDITWIDNSNVDTEWAASGINYYGKVTGDYNIETLKGAIASTIMKLQMWMPQAVIVVCTPISGSGTTDQLNKTGFGLYRAVAPTKDACLKMSIPCIDVFGTDGINGINRISYIADGIHPYTKEGSKMIARAIIGGLKCIEPKDLFND